MGPQVISPLSILRLLDGILDDTRLDTPHDNTAMRDGRASWIKGKYVLKRSSCTQEDSMW